MRFDLPAPDPETQPFWDAAFWDAAFHDVGDDVTIRVFVPA